MATINEITNAASYTGSKELGGFVPSAIDIDTKPLQTLAAYTVIKNKANYDQRQIDADQKIKELAELAQYDITDARGKDRDELVGLLAQIEKDAREYAMKGVPKSPQEKIQQELEFQTKVRDAKAKIVAMNGRKLGYQIRLNAINSTESDAKVKAKEKEFLDEEFNSTDWRTPISAQEKFKVVLPEIGEGVFTENVTSVDYGNGVVQQETKIFNQKKTNENSLVQAMGLQQPPGPNATEEEIRQWEITQASGGEMKILSEAVGSYNGVIKSYIKSDNTIDEEAIKGNAIAYAQYNGIKKWNEYAREMKENVKRGFFTTQLGKRVSLLGVVKEDDFFEIDPTKPLSVEHAISVQKFLQAGTNTKSEKIIETDNQIQNRNLDLEARNISLNEWKAKNPTPTSGGKGEYQILEPAAKMKEHMITLANWFERNPGKSALVPLNLVDEKTQRALGIKLNEDGTQKTGVVQYNRDGSFYVVEGAEARDGVLYKDGKPISAEIGQKGNLTGLKQGFIDAYKQGSSGGAVVDENYQKSSEDGYRQTFLGYDDVNVVWKALTSGGALPAPKTESTAPKTKVVNGKTLVLPQ